MSRCPASTRAPFAAERDQLLASFENEQGFREHFGKIIALNTKKKIHPTSEYVTYYYERFRWSLLLFIAAFFTGLRFTDLRFLKWSSVDLKGGVIRLVMRKTKRAVTIPITPRLREALQECRKRAIVSEYVLVTPEGKPYSKATIMRYFKIAKAIAGIKRPFRFHDQRHTFASILATNGINSFTLRDLLGHTSTALEKNPRGKILEVRIGRLLERETAGDIACFRNFRDW